MEGHTRSSTVTGWFLNPAAVFEARQHVIQTSSHIVAPLSNVDLGTVSGVECFGWVMVVEVVVNGIWTLGLAVEVLLREGGGWALVAGLVCEQCMTGTDHVRRARRCTSFCLLAVIIEDECAEETSSTGDDAVM